MRKLSVIIFVALIALCSIKGVDAAKSEKIGYVDLSRLFDEYHKTKEYDKVLEGKHNEFQKQAESKLDKIREQEGRLDLLKDEKKEELQKQVDEMKAELLDFDRQEKTTLAKERNEKIREILLEIEKIVSDFAEKEGYGIILNDRVLIYADTTYNVTEDIMKILNK